MLERLVAAVRSPKLADQRSDPAGEVLAGLVSMAVARMRRSADHLNVDSLDEEWEEGLAGDRTPRMGGRCGSPGASGRVGNHPAPAAQASAAVV